MVQCVKYRRRKMQIYSTKFPISEQLTKEKFVELVIEWNQGSPYDKMECVVWDRKEYDLRFKEGKRSLMINCLLEHDVIASRFRKEDEYGVVWTTDFVLNCREKMLAVKLERETTDSTTSFIPKFLPPYFIRSIVHGGYAGEDNGLPIIDQPMMINMENYQIIRDIILKKSRYALPIVYITKTWAGNYPLAIDKLVTDLQGVAHVLKESDPAVSKILKEECNGENAHHGGIAIYYPSVSARNKKINSQKYEKEDLHKKIVNMIRRYMNQQIRDNMYTWEGVQNEKIRLKNRELLENHDEIKHENEKLYEIFEEQLKEYETSIASLNNRVIALEQENHGLRDKIEGLQEIPLIYLGEEEE